MAAKESKIKHACFSTLDYHRYLAGMFLTAPATDTAPGLYLPLAPQHAGRRGRLCTRPQRRASSAVDTQNVKTSSDATAAGRDTDAL
ncbi:hypothetical protein AB0H94_08990 [Streptomyces purpurascens]|uniref:hypothetical protein n=1 Tax=Streptomyces purpurascens TaxID=1924 RepID=UPI00340C0DF3